MGTEYTARIDRHLRCYEFPAGLVKVNLSIGQRESLDQLLFGFSADNWTAGES